MADNNTELSSLLDIIKKADIIRKGTYGKDVRTAIADAIMLAATGTTTTDDDQNATLEKINTNLSTLGKDLDILLTPANHANIYRGKSLGNSVTSAQLTAISNGTFDDMFVGDYWTINGTTYRIADFDYWYNQGDTAFTKHHIVVVNDNKWKDNWHGVMNAKIDDKETTVGAYVGSDMYTKTLPETLKIIENDFGADHVLSHREYLQNAVSNGQPSGGTWFDSKIELLNEIMVYGCKIFSTTGTANNYTVENSQLALMRLNHHMINQDRQWYWLRDVVSSASFADVGINGYCRYDGASNDTFVRVAFP